MTTKFMCITNTKTFTVIPAAAVLLMLSFITIFSYQYGWQWIDSEHSAEMVLGRLLSQENALVSPNWLYTTEIRIIYQTIFTMPLFKLLDHLDNWPLIRALNILLNNITLVLSYIFLMKSMKVQAKWSLITALFLLMPLSVTYWNIVTFGGYYIIFIAQLFCCLGLFIRLARHEGAIKAKRMEWLLFILLSFALGAQSIRSLFAVHIPLLLSCGYMRYYHHNKKNLLYGGVGFIACCAGFAVNNLLHHWYSFMSYGDMGIDNLFANYFSKLGRSLANIAGFFGLATGTPVFSVRGFMCIAALFAAIIVLRLVYVTLLHRKGQPPFMQLFFAISLVFNMFVFIVANHAVIDRYFIPFMVLYVPLAALFCEHAEKAYQPLKRMAAVCGIILFVIAQGCLTMHGMAGRDNNSIRKGYIQYLLNNRFEYGFATPMNSNITTELTNGMVEVAGLDPRQQSGSGAQLFRMHDCMNKAQFLDPQYHSGESFLLLTREEWNSFSRRIAFAGVKPDYEDNHFAVIRYPSSQALHSSLVESQKK